MTTKMRTLRTLPPLFAACAFVVACGADNTAGLEDNEVSDRDTTADSSAEDTDASDDTESDGSGDTTADAADTDGSGDAALDVPPSRCPPDMCEIDGKCIDNGAANPDNGCEICLVLVSPVDWSFDDTAACDDGDPCTDDDTCFQGACMGTLDTCDDGNPCTAGICDPLTGECVQRATSGAACNDSDPCTVGDYCTGGVCSPGAGRLDCDDGNACTADRCQAGEGCVATPINGRDCDDGTACTVGDMCRDGVCVPGEDALECEDGNLCTLDWCDPDFGCRTRSVADLCGNDNPCTEASCDPALGCVYAFIDAACTDGTSCTVSDRCVEGICRGTPLPTDDGNECTDDLCTDAGGVQHIPHTRPCDDRNVCTIGDTCSPSGCLPGTTLQNCDDGNPCTDDYCDAARGCMNVPNNLPCDDGDLCTIGDICGGGVCRAYPMTCLPFNVCAISFCDELTGSCDYDVLQTPECRPTITLDYPPRGVTLLDDGSHEIDVRGHVYSAAGGIGFVSVNTNLVPVAPDGRFQTRIAPYHGGNILVVEATDAVGTQGKVVQSFLYSDQYTLPNAAGTVGHIAEGMGFYLADASLSVLANVMALVLKNMDLNGMLPDPVADTAGHTIRPKYPNPVTFGNPSATLDALTPSLAGYPARMRVRATIPSVRVNLRISGWACSGDITYTASSLVVDAEMHLRVVANALDSVLGAPNATIYGGDLDVSCSFPGLGSLIELVVGDLSGDFESAIEDALSGELGPLIADAFDAFALEFDLELPSLDDSSPPVSVTLQTDFQRVSSDNDGLNMVQRTMVATDHLVPYVNLGMPMRRQCGAGPHTVQFDEANPLEVVLSFDSINQMLHGAWRGGLLEFDVPPEMLGDVDLSAYGVTDLVLHASGMLAPTLSDCASGGAVWVHIGDLAISASMSLLGVPLDAVIYISMLATLEMDAREGAVSLGISSINRVEMQVVIDDPELFALGDTLEGLLRENLVPALLGALGGGALGSFPLPEIDVSGSIEGVPAGTAIRIVPRGVHRLSGNYVIGAVLQLFTP